MNLALSCKEQGYRGEKKLRSFINIDSAKPPEAYKHLNDSKNLSRRIEILNRRIGNLAMSSKMVK